MENQPQPHKARKKISQPVKSATGASSQPPQDSGVQKSTSATQTTAPAIPTTKATEKEATPSTTAHPPENAFEAERIMREFLAKFGKEEKPSAVLAKMAEALRVQEEASQLTPLNIPPRSSTLQEMTTAQVLTSLRDEPQRSTESLPQATEPLSAATHEENASSTSISVPNQPRKPNIRWKR